MSRSKSGLFLMELIIVIAFFAVTSTICLQLFATAYRLSTRSLGLQMAVVNAQSAAETFKVTDGDTAYMASIFGGEFSVLTEDRLVILYDDNWTRTGDNIRFEMLVVTDLDIVPASAVITVRDILLNEELYTLTVRRYLR